MEVPVPVMTAVLVALGDASDDAALERILENCEDRVADNAGLVATMLESWELMVDATSDRPPVLDALETCEEMEETTLLMLDSVDDGSRPVIIGLSKPLDSVDVVFGALVGVG